VIEPTQEAEPAMLAYEVAWCRANTATENDKINTKNTKNTTENDKINTKNTKNTTENNTEKTKNNNKSEETGSTWVVLSSVGSKLGERLAQHLRSEECQVVCVFSEVRIAFCVRSRISDICNI
jgi:hypothetical protein